MSTKYVNMTMKMLGTLLFIVLSYSQMLNAQAKDCNIILNGIDSQLYVKRIEMGQEVLFSHTHPQLKASLRNREMVIGKANISVLDDDYYIRIEVAVASKNARNTYGYIPQTNTLTIKFIDGKQSYLYSAADAKGIYDQRRKKMVYNVFYLIKDVKELRKKELDKIGIFWTTGYEEYAIYDIQLLMRQLECLDKL